MASLIDDYWCRAAWLFDGEATGEAAIDTGGGPGTFNLTDTGAVDVGRGSAHTGFGTGVYASFAGGASDTRLVSGGAGPLPVDAWSICLWAYINDTVMPTTTMVVMAHESATSSRCLRIYFDPTASRFKAAVSTGGTVTTLTAPSAPDVKTWYWFCLTMRGQALYFYQNNVMSGLQTPVIGDLDQNTEPWSLGALNDGDAATRFKGFIDEMVIFSRPLTAPERELIYTGGLGTDVLTLQDALRTPTIAAVDAMKPAVAATVPDVALGAANLLTPEVSVG